MADRYGAQVQAVRRFNRFYTRRIGVLEERLLASSFTLTQGRVLFELGTRRSVTAGELIELLGLDGGYLSRLLRGFAAAGLIARRQSREDARRVQLSLTARGRKAFEALDRRSSAVVAEMLAPLGPAERERLLSALDTVQQILAAPAERPGHPAAGGPEVTLRSWESGDLGWAIQLHGTLYAQEYGWNRDFEAFVAGLCARFASQHDPQRERFWVAEVNGERAGCVFVVRNEQDARTAQLRCLLVDPRARGLGIGARLLQQCLDFAKAAGYRRMVLWTNDVLVAARRLYERAGFSLIEESRHHSFGHDLVGQVWERSLGQLS